MKKSVYLKRAQKLYDSGAVSCEVYDAMLMNIDVFCDNEDEDESLPDVNGGVRYGDSASSQMADSTK